MEHFEKITGYFEKFWESFKKQIAFMMSPVNQRSELRKVMQTSKCKAMPQICTQHFFFGNLLVLNKCVFGTSSGLAQVFFENFCFIFQNLHRIF